ncbi:MAG: HlyD family secretion protein [Paludibacteraceae bacterium]|nr:HlyD family secretion protein [Paludibacteraceae bacterium]
MNKSRILTYLYNTLIVLLLTSGIVYVVLQFTHFGRIEYTDNARVCQFIAPQNTRVQGFIKEIRFEAYQHVNKGDTLVIIEDSEFRLRLAQARSDLARAKQQCKQAGSSVRTANSNISVIEATKAEAKANMDNLERDDYRCKQLLKTGSVSQQVADQAHTAFLAAKARYEQICHSIEVQRSAVDETDYNRSAVEAAVELAQAAVELAQLNLSYCYITATHCGVVGDRDINTGELVNPGQTLVSIVDESSKWVEANYRETQLPNINHGAKVKITVDAVPDVVYIGRVATLSDATGSAFSLIPVDNATGNFVKVEQRLTVRISLDGTDDSGNPDNSPNDLAKLKAGYSVECEVKY